MLLALVSFKTLKAKIYQTLVEWGACFDATGVSLFEPLLRRGDIFPIWP